MDQEVVAARSGVANPIRSGTEYIESLRGRRLTVYLMGELVDEPVDHPMIRPSINAVAKTYDLANEDPALASAVSPLTKMPAAVRRTRCRNRSGSDCCEGERPRSPLTSVIAPPMTRFSACMRARNCINRAW